MKRLLCVTVVAAVTAIGCTSAKKDSGKPAASVDGSLKTKLLFALPDISKLTAGERLASDVMTHYLFSIKEVEGSCVNADKAHKAFDLEQMNAIDSSVLTASVPANCDYLVQLSLGVASSDTALTEAPSDIALADTSSKATYADTLKATVDLKCGTCHSSAAAQGDVDLSTPAGVIANKVGMVASVSGASMPPKTSPQLTSSEKTAFKTWQSGGYEMGADASATDTTASARPSAASLDKVFYWNKTPLTISKTDLQKYKTFSSVIALSLTSDGKAAGFTTATLKTIEEKSEGNDATVKDPVDTAVKDKGTGTTASGVYYADVQGIIQKNCVSCHPNKNQSDLSTYAAFMKRSDSSLNRIIAGTMPTAGALGASDIALLKKWQSAGYPEKASTSSTTKPTSTNTDTNLVEFHIPAGTGSSPWNSAADPVVLKAGQILKIINDDSEPHQLHTDGQPCQHGSNMRGGGGSYSCATTRSFSGQLHDHNNDQTGFFYVKVTK